jgi:hypothetical protein
MRQLQSAADMSARKGNLREEALAFYRLGVLCENAEVFNKAMEFFELFWKVVVSSGDLLGICQSHILNNNER